MSTLQPGSEPAESESMVGRTALTGTPGTGKTTVAALLRKKGFNVVMGDQLAGDLGALDRYDPIRETWEVDLSRLDANLLDSEPMILVAHYAHRLRVDRAIVLRCHPEVLRERLQGRGWPEKKISENLEAEALSVITAEALERVPTFEVDTTKRDASETLEICIEVLGGRGRGYRAPVVDWSGVILDWY